MFEEGVNRGAGGVRYAEITSMTVILSILMSAAFCHYLRRSVLLVNDMFYELL